ncbi:MAG: Uma2 family endonuclease [Nostoc sp.]|uniref:Uma2 family endonuclease n=1 Tax=Nostoc sp. TaxID=1180 RepID=UPI002FF56EC5
MQTQTEKRYYTREEYLALEEAAEYKSEYLDGEIVPMAGGTTNHNHIIVNLVAHLKFALRGQNYNLFTSDVRLWIPSYRRYTYPDIMAIAGKPEYESESNTTVTNPLIIIEVLSKLTRSYDESDKFRCYRSIPEFKEYILIDQYKFYVEQFAKNSDAKWVLTEYESPDALLTLASINFQISFSDIYEMVNF